MPGWVHKRGLALLLAATVLYAENVRLVSSPSRDKALGPAEHAGDNACISENARLGSENARLQSFVNHWRRESQRDAQLLDGSPPTSTNNQMVERLLAPQGPGGSSNNVRNNVLLREGVGTQQRALDIKELRQQCLSVVDVLELREENNAMLSDVAGDNIATTTSASGLYVKQDGHIKSPYNTEANQTLQECKKKCGDGTWKGCVGFTRYKATDDSAEGKCWWTTKRCRFSTDAASKEYAYLLNVTAAKKKKNTAYRSAYRSATACEHHSGLTGPFPGLKLPNGTDASPTWYKPYQHHTLADALRDNNCNPASCDNVDICGIPVCRGISLFDSADHSGTGGHDGRWAAMNIAKLRQDCKGKGCGVEKYAQVVKSTFPSKDNELDAINGTDRTGQSIPMTAADAFPGHAFLAGIRFGVYGKPVYATGDIAGSPKPGEYCGEYAGAWISPDQRHCNPIGWLSAWKTAIGHTGLTPYSDDSAGTGLETQRSAVVLTKLIVCLNAICDPGDASCAPKKCYTSKQGKCVQFTESVMPRYMSGVNRTHIDAAYLKFKAGAYTACTPDATEASRVVISGN